MTVSAKIEGLRTSKISGDLFWLNRLTAVKILANLTRVRDVPDQAGTTIRDRLRRDAACVVGLCRDGSDE